MIKPEDHEIIIETVRQRGFGTMAQLARQYGVSRQRIQRIVGPGLRVKFQQMQDREHRAIGEAALKLLRDSPTMPVGDVATRFNITAAELHAHMQAVDEEEWKRWARPSTSRRRTWWGVRCSSCESWKPYAQMARDRERGVRTLCRQCASRLSAARVKARQS